MPHYVTDEDAELVLRKLEEIKKIAADCCRRSIIMSERERRTARNVVPRERRILTRQQGELEFARHAEIGLKLSVFGRKLGTGHPEPIPLFFQGVFHPLHSRKILVNATDPDDFASGVPEG